jgi:aryl-alcohol dehydrogenase-like predicted oxidoreductase
MNYRLLGKSGLKVSELCLGAMTFGREADEVTSFKMMDAFADAGGTFIDTADVYTRGVSETITGKWLAEQEREEYIIATKVRFTMGNGVNQVGLSRKHILDGVHNSLRRLNVDYIDLYQVHCFDPLTPLKETLGTLHRLVEEGKVRYIGVSNYKAYQFKSRRHQQSDGLGTFHQPTTSLQHARPFLRMGNCGTLPARRLGHHPVESLARWLANRQISSGHGRSARRYAHRQSASPRLERTMGGIRQRTHMEHH